MNMWGAIFTSRISFTKFIQIIFSSALLVYSVSRSTADGVCVYIVASKQCCHQANGYKYTRPTAVLPA